MGLSRRFVMPTISMFYGIIIRLSEGNQYAA